MNKPIKPKKPHKNDKKPSEDLIVQKWICVDGENNVFLRPVEYNAYGYIDDYRKSDLYYLENIDYYDLERLHKILGHGYNLTAMMNYDSFSGWLVSWTEDNKNYDKELEEYERRFDAYEAKLKIYELEMLSYNRWKKEQEILKLNKKIEELKNN
jgi:hypothetical protein